jgi:hypothetical protein
MYAKRLQLLSPQKVMAHKCDRSTGNSYILLPQKFGPTHVGKLRKQGPLVHTITSNTSDTETDTF